MAYKPNIFPRTISDQLSFLFLIASIISIYTFELVWVSPYVHQARLYFYYMDVTCGTFIAINIVGDLYFMITTDTTSGSIILPSVLKPKWRFCPACEANSPPRSFHCNVCQICILKRDHHCTFAGKCIGHKNFRYFFVFLVYLAIGSVYASMLNMFYIWDLLGGFNGTSLAAHIVPFVFFMLGYLDFPTMIASLLSVISLTGCLFVTSLLIYHVRHMLKNQTTYESNNGITEYNLDCSENIVQYLGVRWHLIWLFPTVESPLPSDGIEFLTKEEYFESAEKYK